MEFIKEEDRIYVEDEQGELLAEITFPRSHGVLVINHTYVSDRLRGQGVASKLMETLMQELHTRKETFRTTCSYANAWMAKHPEEQEGWIH